MSQDRFDSVPHEYPRSFVPAEFDAGDWEAVAPLFDRLAEADLGTPEQVEAWLRDGSELMAVVYEEYSKRNICRTLATDDEEIEKSYLDFIRTVLPRLKTKGNELDGMYLESAGRKVLPGDRYEVYDRDKENEFSLFREENVPLETKCQEESQEYQKLCGAMTVEIAGEEVTLQTATKELHGTDRARREDAWRKIWKRRLQDREAIETIFDSLVKLRETMAANADFESFRDFQHRKLGRFDYTPEHCDAFHAAVERHVVPAILETREDRRTKMGLETLLPWDLEVDPLGREPLTPFEKPEELIAGVSRIFDRLDPVLGGHFGRMRELDMLDLGSRVGKAPGGYQTQLFEARIPFIFMNAVGLHGDVKTLLHEGGHAFHSMAVRDEPLMDYRFAPMEFCEVASMSMELLGAQHLDEFYDEADAARAKKDLLVGTLNILPWVASIDAFQHWVYTNPGHTREQRHATWMGIMARFPNGADWTGFEDILASRWLYQSHLFTVPFYYIEYGIAQLGALQVWSRARVDPADALARYRQSLALGGSRPLPELFEAAGIRFDFGPETVEPLVDAVREELATLKDV